MSTTPSTPSTPRRTTARGHLSLVGAERPVRVALLDTYELAAAGTRVVLRPFAARVTVVELDAAMADPRSVDVVLYEPVRQSPAGQEMLRRLVGLGGARAVVYSWRDRAEGASYGAFAGHLSKALPADGLVRAIEAVHRGEGDDAALPMRAPVDRGPLRAIRACGPDLDLTAREAEILSLVTQGLTNSEISGRLYLSINSVKTYIRTAYRKIGVTRRSQAVAWGMSHGLAPLASDVVNL
ncbi:response regulator transcription factor [Nocardioides sp. TRM66260-LWL]|uniref:response regulator transcription factor n=1 Tax=Nocardioides sp. TRM66260-LWL TaxID=2874478 RepID=UPI001CC68A92|nr:response regulator transcription factor [Nocardioides sp. TRM66260-LWL]MBZ5736025.1 response regulator transcription factor [Nocardioides sp. TRM66260-LWL]